MITAFTTNPAALDPRKELATSQIGLLRHAAMFQMKRTGNGWAGGNRFVRKKTMQPLITKGLLIETTRWGKLVAEPSTDGRLALEKLDSKTRSRSG